MDNIITTPLGTLYFRPKNNKDKYFDKLFVYHDRFIDDDDSTVDVLGFVSLSAYSGVSVSSELNKCFSTNMGDFIDLFDKTFRIAVTEYIHLSGLINYLTFARFNTTNVDLNQSPETKKNKELIYEEVKYYIDKIKSYIDDYLCLSEIVDLEFEKYKEEKKGI